MELATQLSKPKGPYPKSQVTRALGIARGTLYGSSKRAIKDDQVAIAIARWHEVDNTLGHRRLAVLLHMGRHRIRRVMHKYGIIAQQRRKQLIPSRDFDELWNDLYKYIDPMDSTGIIFTKVFVVMMTDGTFQRGYFVLLKRTGHCLGWCLQGTGRSDLAQLVGMFPPILFPFTVPENIWQHSQDKLFSDKKACRVFLTSGFQRSTSDEKIGTDNEYAERFMELFEREVVNRRLEWQSAPFAGASMRWVDRYNSNRPYGR